MRINLLLSAMALLVAGSSGASDVFDMEPYWTSDVTGGPTNLRIHAACLNEDTFPDLIVGNTKQAKLSVFYGNGDGTFYPGEDYFGYEPIWIESADIDNDGDLDVLIRFSVAQPDSIAVFLNTGNGQLEDPVCFQATGTYAGQFVVCDFNADTYLDVLTLTETGIVYLMIGNGSSDFSLQQIFDGDEVSLGFACSDIDIDGDIDIVLICNGRLSVLLNNGDGSVTWNGYFGVFSNESFECSLDIGYLDDDNYPDIASMPGATLGEFSVFSFLGDGLGGFSQTGTGWIDLGFGLTQTDLEDYDLDGYNDAFFTGYGNLLMIGDGTGSLAPDYFNYSHARCWEAAVIDLDLDGDIDYVTATSNIPTEFQLEVFLNKIIQLGVEGSPSSTFGGSSTLGITENPVFGSSNVQITLPESSSCSLIAYDIQGRRASVLQEGFLSAGNHSVSWDAGDLQTGCYMLVLQTPSGSSSIRCVIVD